MPESPSVDGGVPVRTFPDLLRWRHDSPAPFLTYRNGLRISIAFALTALAFATISDLVAWGFGQPLHVGGSVTSRSGLLDAGWHAAAGFLMVLPAANLRLCLFGPILATEIDVDHLFGAYFPTEIGRPAHSLFFLVLVVLVLGAVAGRTGAYLAAAGTLGHFGVDGGGFPFLSPASTATWSLPLVLEVTLVLVAVLLFFGALRPWSDLGNERVWVPLAVIAVSLALLLVAGGPTLVQVGGV